MPRVARSGLNCYKQTQEILVSLMGSLFLLLVTRLVGVFPERIVTFQGSLGGGFRSLGSLGPLDLLGPLGLLGLLFLRRKLDRIVIEGIIFEHFKRVFTFLGGHQPFPGLFTHDDCVSSGGRKDCDWVRRVVHILFTDIIGTTRKNEYAHGSIVQVDSWTSVST